MQAINLVNQINIPPISHNDQQLVSQLRGFIHANESNDTQYRRFMEQHSRSLADIFGVDRIQVQADALRNELNINCPISASLFVNPVQVPCGSNPPHIFEKVQIEAWMRGGRSTCPTCRSQIVKSGILPHEQTKNDLIQFQNAYTESIFGHLDPPHNATFNDINIHRIETGGLISTTYINNLPNINHAFTYMNLKIENQARCAKLPVFYPSLDQGANQISEIFTLAEGNWMGLVLASYFSSIFSAFGQNFYLQLTNKEYGELIDDYMSKKLEYDSLETLKYFVTLIMEKLDKSSDLYKWLGDLLDEINNKTGVAKKVLDSILTNPTFLDAQDKIWNAAFIGALAPITMFGVGVVTEGIANKNYSIIAKDIADASEELNQSKIDDSIPSNIRTLTMKEILNSHGNYSYYLTWWWYKELRTSYFFLNSAIDLYANNFSEALTSCDKGLELQPQNIFLKYHKSLALMGLGNITDAITMLRNLEETSFYAEAKALKKYISNFR